LDSFPNRNLLGASTIAASAAEGAFAVTETDAIAAEGRPHHQATAWGALAVGMAGGDPDQPILLRTTLDVGGEVSSATLRATALGAYQVAINGTDVDDQVFKPGWTAYHARVGLETTDVTGLLTSGENVLAVRLGGMWATETFGWREQAARLADQPSFSAELVIDYADGRQHVVRTDTTWRTSTAEYLSATLYQGEHVDARKAQPGWDRSGFDDSSWTTVVEVPGLPQPVDRTWPAMRRTGEFAVAEVITTPSGKTVLDFGQNLVGRLRITVRGDAGTTVTLRHAEVLEHGELGTRPLRRAAATDSYTLAGTGEETYEPEFTFHGFRYAEISGWPGTFDPVDVTAVVVGSDLRRTGWFTSSHELLNRLHENVVWGMRGNFVSVPTDCPQRDERLGWTGDIEVFSPTASFLFDTSDFLSSWLVDLALEQGLHDGEVPQVIPHPPMMAVRGTAAWGDAATVVPTVLYERFGDEQVLRDQLASMAAWNRWQVGRADDFIWRQDFQYGDWLDPAAPPDKPGDVRTEHPLTATAYLIRSADLTARAARLLGEDTLAEEFDGYAAKGRAAFRQRFITSPGRLTSDAQTAYALVIMFDLVPAEEQQAYGDRLAELVAAEGDRIGTGFVGTPIVLDALDRTGHHDEIQRLLLQTENPSWLYPVTMGATTIWERWDSMLPDGTINPGNMTSFNHYAFGAVADYLHRRVAGLAPAAPGYTKIRFAPLPLPALDFAEARYLTSAGEAKIRWERTDGTITVAIDVPDGVTGEVVLPDGTTSEVGSGHHELTSADPYAA